MQPWGFVPYGVNGNQSAQEMRNSEHCLSKELLRDVSDLFLLCVVGSGILGTDGQWWAAKLWTLIVSCLFDCPSIHYKSAALTAELRAPDN